MELGAGMDNRVSLFLICTICVTLRRKRWADHLAAGLLLVRCCLHHRISQQALQDVVAISQISSDFASKVDEIFKYKSTHYL